MTAAQRILKFLRDPNSAFSSASDPEVWLDGLRLFATPQLAAAGDHALRDAQVRAWERLANASAGLVLGPPGTGKTHLLAWFIVGYVQARLAKNLPAKVFVSAFTKNAIGNLLDAVARRRAEYAPGAFECVFMGDLPPAGLSDQIEHCGLRATADADGVLHRLTAPAVVLGGSIWSLSKLTARPNAGGDGYTADLFDLICIDEASQMVVSHGLMALAGLKEGGRLVVAGDDRQLPPIRSSREIELEGRKLGGSLYGFMKSANAPECELDETFRLNAPLAEFPRDAFYNQNYRSTDETALKRLRLSESWRDGLEPWEADVLDPDWPVSVLLHDGPPAATNNPFEAGLVGRLASLLADRMEGARNATGYADDLWSERLAIVSPHRAQNAAIRKSLPKALGTAPFVETVDRIQGKERDAVLMSYCVADAEFAVAEAAFIFASERLNVAVTRARSKLILVVSRRLLEAVPNDQELMDKAQLLREFVFGAAGPSGVDGCRRGGATGPEIPAHDALDMLGQQGDVAAGDINRLPVTNVAVAEVPRARGPGGAAVEGRQALGELAPGAGVVESRQRLHDETHGLDARGVDQSRAGRLVTPPVLGEDVLNGLEELAGELKTFARSVGLRDQGPHDPVAQGVHEHLLHGGVLDDAAGIGVLVDLALEGGGVAVVEARGEVGGHGPALHPVRQAVNLGQQFVDQRLGQRPGVVDQDKLTSEFGLVPADHQRHEKLEVLTR